MRTLSRRKPWIANLALLAGSFALALGGAELVLRALYESDYEIHPRGLYSADPAVGYVPTPGFTGTFVRDEYAHGVTIGNSGLRGADPRPRRPDLLDGNDLDGAFAPPDVDSDILAMTNEIQIDACVAHLEPFDV